jgi:molybdopterin molybdotransferase
MAAIIPAVMAITPRMAEQTIAARLKSLPIEFLPLEQCIGRTLRQDVYAERDNPPFDRVCMDGIAIRSEGSGRRFVLEGTQAAGAPAVSLAHPANAVEVMTGAVLPRGTDCVVPLEEYELADSVVLLKDSAHIKPYRNVQRRGEDSEPGVPMLRAGTRLSAPEMAVVASAGLARVQVSAQPKFMVISTGDELVEPGQPIAEHQVRRSNVYAVVAALREHGFGQVGNDHIEDNEAVLRERLARHLAEHDVLILSGGISKGRFDLVPQALKALRVEEIFQQVAQRPGMPMWFGIGSSGQAVFGLPGNPVSTLMCLVRYVIPALVRAMGATPREPEMIGLAQSIALGRKMASFVPVLLRHDARGIVTAVPRPTNGPGDFLSLAGTDGFIELPAQSDPFPDGYVARLYRW